VYRLLTMGTIEEKIQALKQKKQQLFDAMIGNSGDMFKKLTWDDVRDLFANEKT
jgi:SNF2 family DNA or RNA helicase